MADVTRVGARKATLLAVCVALVLPAGADAKSCKGTKAQLSATNAKSVSRAVVCLLNRERKRAGLKRLRANAKLSAAATKHSQDMVANGYFEHTSPDGDTLVSRAKQAGYLNDEVDTWALAENIARGSGGFGTPARIVKDWMGSEVHRHNILQRTLRDVGVGLATGMPGDPGRGVTYTLDLGLAR